MTETKTDVFSDGIGVLASDRGAVSDLQENSPIAVSGVAIPENQILQGGQGIEHFFSPEKAQEAAQVLSNQIESGDIVHLVKNFHDTEGQATADDVMGEVTSAGYQKGVGVVFEGEITDEDIAQKIMMGYLDVSPSVMRSLGGLDETMQARAVDEVAGFRDIAVVARGQPGAEVEVGPNPAVEALSQNITMTETNTDLYSGIDTLQLSQARRPTYQGTETSDWSAPNLEDFVSGYGEISSDVSSINDLTDSGRSLIASKTLLGDPDGETFREVAFFPVVNPSTDNLNRNALVAVRGGRGQQADIPSDAYDSASRIAGELLNDEFNSDVDVEADTMSYDEALETVGEEHDMETDEVVDSLTQCEPENENLVTLIEAD